MLRNKILITAGLMALALPARAQNPIPSIFLAVPGPADWNTASNWTSDAGPFVPGDGFADEVAEIGNGGTAFLSAAAQFPIDGLLLSSGTLQIRNGGSLNVTQSATSQFFGLGRTNLGGAGLLELSGSGKLNTTELNVGNGTIASTFTPATTTPIQVSGAATLGGTLTVGFSGLEPAFGQTFKIVDAAPNQLTGTFGNVETAGVPRGLAAVATYDAAAGDVSITLENRLVLSVDRRTGAASIANVIGGAIAFDGYTITSASANLDPAGWQSLDDQNAPAGWFEANPSTERLSELKPSGSTSLAAAASLSLGAPFGGPPAEFGTDVEDLSFSYFTPDGETERGIVEYTGLHNNIVLLVDPATGEAAIQNQSTFNVSIDFYTITSASGSLDPTGWESLDDQNIGVWAEANPTDSRLSELYPVGGSAFTPGKGYEIGNAFTVGGAQDLEFRFTFADGTSYDGIVEYGEFTIGTGPVGDTNGDGQVNLDDLNNVRNNFGGAGLGDTDGDNDVDLDDLNNVRNNFGATSSAAVPEPATWLLALLGVPFAARRLRRR